jgi:hypothetical protein
MDVQKSGNRVCGNCALCCKLMAITELEKPAGAWCGHVRGEKSCAIYDARPPTCRAWNCGYLLLPFLGEHWHPPRSGMVVHWDTARSELKIIVNQGSQRGWMKDPYAADVARLDDWCRAKTLRLTIREGEGHWTFDPRGISNGPLFTTHDEDVVGLGVLPLFKAHRSLRDGCRLAQATYKTRCAAEAPNARLPRHHAAALALDALADAGLVIDWANDRISAYGIEG